MEFDENLYNAAVVAENPEMAFLVNGNLLHAVEPHIMELQKEKSKPEIVLPLMRKALDALLQFAKVKAPHEFAEMDLKAISLKPNEQEQLVEKMKNIYFQLHHNDRVGLSSLIHHKAAVTKKN